MYCMLYVLNWLHLLLFFSGTTDALTCSIWSTFHSNTQYLCLSSMLNNCCFMHLWKKHLILIMLCPLTPSLSPYWQSVTTESEIVLYLLKNEGVNTEYKTALAIVVILPVNNNVFICDNISFDKCVCGYASAVCWRWRLRTVLSCSPISSRVFKSVDHQQF